MLKRNRGHELLARQLPPRRNVTHRRDHDGVEKNADNDSHPDRFEKTSSAEPRTRLFRPLDHRFKTRHVIGHDLNYEKYGDKSAVGEQRRKILRRTLAHSDCDEHQEQTESSEGRPVLEGRAQPDAAVVQQSQKAGEAKSDDDMRQIHRTAGDTVELHRIQRRKNVTRYLGQQPPLPTGTR